jgi:hypothetical protein
VVSIPACHAGDPGSIPGNGDFFASMFSVITFLCVFWIYLAPRELVSLFLYVV